MTAKKKLLIMAGVIVAVVAIVAGSVLGTIAYMTSASKVSNVFTVGNVKITLDESVVNNEGKIVDRTNRTDRNSYHLMPGKSYDKDPQIHVQADTESCYLFLVTRNQILDIEVQDDPNKPTMRQQMVQNGWGIYKTTTAGSVVWIYCGSSDNVYHNATATDAANYAAKGSENYMHAKTPVAVCGTSRDVSTEDNIFAKTDINVFSEFHITTGESANLSIYAGAEVTINAVGIQCDSFGAVGSESAVNAAWTAVVNQFPYIQDDVATTENNG